MKNLIKPIDMTEENIKGMSKKMSRYERKANKAKKEIHKKVSSFKAKLTVAGLGVSLAIVLLLYGFVTISNWYAAHKVEFYKIKMSQFVNNLVVITKIEEPKKVDVKKLTNAELISASADKIRKEKEREAFIERLYQATRFLESRVGFDKTVDATHTYCQNIGQVNEVGYFPEGNRHFCFSNEAEQRLTLTRWFSKRLDGMTANEALCLYVTGIRQPMCKRVMEVGL